MLWVNAPPVFQRTGRCASTRRICPTVDDIARSTLCAWREKDGAGLARGVLSLDAAEMRAGSIANPNAPGAEEIGRRLAVLRDGNRGQPAARSAIAAPYWSQIAFGPIPSTKAACAASSAAVRTGGSGAGRLSGVATVPPTP